MFQFPEFALQIYVFNLQFRDVTHGGGCPIRESRDQRMFAPPPGFSQLTTPFINFSAKASTVLFLS